MKALLLKIYIRQKLLLVRPHGSFAEMFIKEDLIYITPIKCDFKKIKCDLKKNYRNKKKMYSWIYLNVVRKTLMLIQYSEVKLLLNIQEKLTTPVNLKEKVLLKSVFM